MTQKRPPFPDAIAARLIPKILDKDSLIVRCLFPILLKYMRNSLPFRRVVRSAPRAPGMMRGMAGLLALMLMTGQTAPVAAAPRQALLIEGKRTLYQRIITKPGADLRPACTEQPGAPVPVFSIYYVYGRTGDCVEVGVNATGESRGFIPADRATDWQQSIVVAFNNRAEAGRERQLFFDTADHLQTTLEQGDAPAAMAALRTAAAAGTPPPDSGVLAIEPEQMIDIEQNFYLLPILGFEAAFLPGGQEGNYLRVASIARPAAAPAAPAAMPAPPSGLDAGIVFVIDTTKSMQPYIDQTLAAVRQIQSVLTSSGNGGAIRFGLTVFRQSTRTNPGIGYHVQQVLPLSSGSTADVFLRDLGAIRAASVSTDGFNEDSLGGIYSVISETDWQPFGARYVVLVTDAGPRDPGHGDVLAPGLGTDQIADLARRRGVRVIALHLRTPSGRDNHEYAADQYRRLTTLDGGDAYLPIPDGRLADFGRQVDSIGRALVANINATVAGRPIQPVDDTPAAEVMARLGRALQLEYFGSRENAAAPEFFEAWTIDKALDDTAVHALDERVMLTKNQLSSLADALRPIVEEGEAPGSQADPATFFQRVQELAARANNDTRQISEDTPLGDLLGEYLADLPYKSYVLNLTTRDWVQFNRQKQREILSALKSKLSYYQIIHNTPARWLQLDPAASDGETVTLIPLYQLP